jgi:hypothetical protein
MEKGMKQSRAWQCTDGNDHDANESLWTGSQPCSRMKLASRKDQPYIPGYFVPEFLALQCTSTNIQLQVIVGRRYRAAAHVSPSVDPAELPDLEASEYP